MSKDTMTTDTPTESIRFPSRDTSTWLVLKLLRSHMSLEGPSFAAGEIVAFAADEARDLLTRGIARLRDEPEPPTPAALPPVRVRLLRPFVDPTSHVNFGSGERILLQGAVAAEAIAKGGAVVDDGQSPPTGREALLARARDRREARGRQR